jgi:hypothetical protein
LTLTFALKQSGTDELERQFWQISHPDHPSYGQFLSNKQVGVLLANVHPVSAIRIHNCNCFRFVLFTDHEHCQAAPIDARRFDSIPGSA